MISRPIRFAVTVSVVVAVAVVAVLTLSMSVVHGFSTIILPPRCSTGRTVPTSTGGLLLLLKASTSSSASSSSSSSTTTDVATANSVTLESMTVPELRQVLKESTVNERGLISRLKRKQDLIDFLRRNDPVLVQIQQQQMQQQQEQQQEEEMNTAARVEEKIDDDNDSDDSTNDDEIDDDIDLQLSEEHDHDLDEDDEIAADDEVEVSLPEVSPETKLNRRGNIKTTKEKPASTAAAGSPALQISSELTDCIPPFMQERMVAKGITSLLPVQVASFLRIYSGQDVVLQAPTGSGKTLAFVLPLLAKNLGRNNNTNKNTTPWRRQKIASPAIVAITPSRELTRQVGKEWQKFSKETVVTVFGGVPLERHVSMLNKSKPRVVVGTPGRLRELVREGHLDYSQLTTVVIDEADTLLDKSDSPDVRAILENMETAVGEREHNADAEDDDGAAEYQLVLVSATINENVVEFAEELELEEDAFIRVQGSESKVLVPAAQSPSTTNDLAVPDVGGGVGNTLSKTNVPTVQHWHMACKSSAYPLIATDLISILSPRLTLVFVPTKSETESVASFLSSTISGSNIRILHGDMAQSARSRNIALTHEAAEAGASQVLVCTDVASRGLDLPNVDLVVQFGVPKLAGKDGTYSTELYTHRSGRTGRVRSAHLQGGTIETANAIMLYDPAVGEGKVVPELVREVQEELGIHVLPKSIPSAAQVVEAAYQRMSVTLGFGRDSTDHGELALHYRSKLEAEEGVDTSDPQQLLDYLARAMVALSNLDSSASPFHQHCSLLSGSDADRTLRLYRNDGGVLAPPEVITFCKSIGSGKLGRVTICKNGSAVFDLSVKKANKLMQAVADESADSDWTLELPLTLPEV
jgi:ATP-dependent RNA helicase DDX21